MTKSNENKRCFIPVECNCCGDMELLFEGKANMMNQIYQLSKGIDGYQFLMVELGLLKENNTQLSDYMMIPNPRLTQEPAYAKVLNIELNQGKLSRWVIIWHFPSLTEFQVDWVEKGDESDSGKLRDDTCITRIYGVS